VKLIAVMILTLIFAPVLLSQTGRTGIDCKSLVMRSEVTVIDEVQPEEGEKYRRPPMVAYEVQDNGDVRKLRLVRHSGSKELDEKLLSTAVQWKYQTRLGCAALKVRLAGGPIPNEAAALKMAEPELLRLYGAIVIASERPLTAWLWGEIWVVSETLHCGKGSNSTDCVGGVATAHLSKSDGRVVEIFHTE
jgi:NTF2 fold immunity protein